MINQFTALSIKKFLVATLWLIIVQTGFAQTIIRGNDPHIRYMGRIDFRGDSAGLSWPGNSIRINFNGTMISALLGDQSGTNYFKVIVDGKVMPDLQLDSGKHLYTLVSGLPTGTHHLELVKRTEWVFGKTWFYHFLLKPGATLAKAPAPKKHTIEFYGNSITCGYGVLDTTGQDRGTAPFEDHYLSYAAITARHFDAEYSCIARSGIGILISWFPQIMPEMYDLLDGNDNNRKWNFRRFSPDVVVIDLFQNDSWLVVQPEHPEFKHRFGSTAPTPEQIIEAYERFVKNIRAKYPRAQIICALGNMDATKEGSAWPGYISKAVENLHDKRINTFFFPFKNTAGHPSSKEQQAMADDLIHYIEKNMNWLL